MKTHSEEVADWLNISLMLYCDYVHDFMIPINESVRKTGLAVQRSFPRKLYELGFLQGKTSYIKDACTLDETLAPEEVSKIITLAADREGKEIILRDCLVTYTKPEDKIAWQHWRAEGILADKYTADNFPVYDDVVLSQVCAEYGLLQTNKTVKYGVAFNYSFSAEGETHLVEFNAMVGHEHEPNEEYRYEYDIIFPNPLEDDILELLEKKVAERK